MGERTKLTIREKNRIVVRMAALANRTRLDCVLLLIEAAPGGLPATEIARRLRAPKNTMSAHFNVLKAAGLVSGQRNGRLVLYRAKIEPLVDVMMALFKDCCAGQPELCKPYLHSFIVLVMGQGKACGSEDLAGV